MLKHRSIRTIACAGVVAAGLAAGRVSAQPAPEIAKARELLSAGKPADAVAILEPFLANDAERPMGWFVLGLSYHKLKDWDKAIAIDRKAASFPNIAADALYNLACAYSMAGKPEESVKALSQALDAGFQRFETLDKDEELDPVRKNPEFIKVMARTKGAAANVGPTAGPGDPAPILESADGIGAKLDAAVIESGKAAKFSGSVLVMHHGKTLLARGYGLADRDANVPISAETVFSIGSITKAFTAAAILVLEQDGKLSTSDPISKFLPSPPADKAGITIHQLLTHSAGLEDYVDLPSEGGDFAKISKEEALKRIYGQTLLFPPGSRSEYSNSGYTLLAMVVEKASGVAFDTIVRDRLFKPAGMTSAGFYGDTQWNDRLVARGYGQQTVEGQRSPNHWPAPMWALQGGGGIVCTAADLGKWCRVLRTDRILNEASRKKMFTAHVPLEQGGGEAYGWMVSPTRRGTPAHLVAGGNAFGFMAAITDYEADDLQIIVTCNAGAGVAEPVASALREVMLTVK